MARQIEGYTPGPWKLIENCCDYQRKDRIVAGQIIADNCDPANSALMAAAPELYEENIRLQALILELQEDLFIEKRKNKKR